MKKYLAVAVATFSVATAHAELLGRDINGGAVAAKSAEAVFEYDTVLNVTWLRDWNYTKTHGFPGGNWAIPPNQSGRMQWYTAVYGASDLNVGGFTGWRLPIDSEFAQVWLTELVDTNVSPNYVSPFVNLQYDFYWSGTASTDYAAKARVFDVASGRSGLLFDKSDLLYAVVVRPGDVSPIPNPATACLMLSGLGVVGAAARRRKAC